MVDEIIFPPGVVHALRNRVLMAASEDMARGTNKLAELLGRIAKDEEPALTAEETGTLRDVHAGKFKRGRGQRRNDRRFDALVASQLRYEWLRKIKTRLQSDPAERDVKRERRGDYDINQRVGEIAHELLQGRRERERQDYPIASAEKLANVLKRGPKIIPIK